MRHDHRRMPEVRGERFPSGEEGGAGVLPRAEHRQGDYHREKRRGEERYCRNGLMARIFSREEVKGGLE